MVEGKRLSEIEKYKTMGIYVKFLESQYLEDLLDGNIFMNNYRYFIELEKRTKEKGQGDKFEASHVLISKSAKY